jgi:hypothetical protein
MQPSKYFNKMTQKLNYLMLLGLLCPLFLLAQPIENREKYDI